MHALSLIASASAIIDTRIALLQKLTVVRTNDVILFIAVCLENYQLLSSNRKQNKKNFVFSYIADYDDGDAVTRLSCVHSVAVVQ